MKIGKVILLAGSLSVAFPGASLSHSGGLNAEGCHAGSKPYHCHRVQNPTRQNSPPVKMSRSRICHAKGTRYYHQTKNFSAYNTVKACLNAGGRLPR